MRTGGSPEEYSAAMLIKQECERLGAQAELEAFPVDGCKIAKAVLKNADTDKEYECCGVGMSGSTPVGGITAPFTYVTSVEDAEIHSHKDVLDFLEEENYYRSCNFIAEFARRLVSSRCFPVEKEIPDDVKQKIDKYYGRKE